MAGRDALGGDRGAKELRDRARKESQAPRSSYELAFRNQFYTPDYVVRFLVDNTLARTWYEMRGGNTRLAEQCEYLVRRPDEVFLSWWTAEDREYREFVDMARQLREGDEESFPAFTPGEREIERLFSLGRCVDGYQRHPMEERSDREWWPWRMKARMEAADTLEAFSTQDLMDVLFFIERWTYWTGGLEHLS